MVNRKAPRATPTPPAACDWVPRTAFGIKDISHGRLGRLKCFIDLGPEMEEKNRRGVSHAEKNATPQLW